jgi:hypothetical protein
MGDLLSEISRSQQLRVLLAELEGRSAEGVLPALVDDLQQLLSRRLQEARGREARPGSGREAVPQEEPSGPVPPAPTVPPEVSPARVVDGAAAIRQPPIAPVVEEAASEAGRSRAEPAVPPVPAPGAAHEDKTFVPMQEISVSITRQHQDRTTFDLASGDTVYCHAVAPIPLEERTVPRPFMLEEKGIENREFAFALDRGGLRFFLSRFNNRAQSISKSGVLLLGKQESIRLRGVHTSVLNGLRVHGILLPFEFGTVAVGKETLLSLIDEHLYDLRDAVDELLSTRRWSLTVSMLDSRLAQFVGSESPAERRERERARPGLYAPSGIGRIDIKTLERVLSKEKKIAEGIHEEVRALASRSGIESMVGLDSGSSDDWKVILRAWYDVDPADIPSLNRLINDIQYRHFLFELMLSLTGARDSYALRPR